MKKKIADNDVEENLMYLAKFINYAGLVATVICAFAFIQTKGGFLLGGIAVTIYVLITTLISSNVLKVLANISLTLKAINGDAVCRENIIETNDLEDKMPKETKYSNTKFSGISLFSWIREIKTNEEFQVIEIYDDAFLCVNSKNMDGKKLKRNEIEPIVNK